MNQEGSSMGRIYNQFHCIRIENEADVNQNFVIPLLTKYLGYSLEDIKPERDYPARDIFFGRRKTDPKDSFRSQRPDYVVCIGDVSNPRFVVESKAPNEDLETYLPQMKSYAIGVGVNFLIITNGISLRIYDVNQLLFEAKSIDELDLRFGEVKKILHRDIQCSCSFPEIMQNIDIDSGKSPEQIIEGEKQKRQIEISDFEGYLKYVEKEFQNWQIPRELEYLEIEKYPPDRLLKFYIHKPSEFGDLDEKKYVLSEIDQIFNAPIKIFIGSSGIGKTTLLKYITYIKACECLNLRNTEIPVYVPLRNYGSNLGLRCLIASSLQKGGMNFSSNDLSEFLQKNTFLFLMDAFDEVQERYLEDVKREIEEFVGIGNHRIIITSRESRQITLHRSSQFFVSELEQDEIENLLEQYLGNDRFGFQFEIERNRLSEESKNTLLLTLMILIYKENQELPPTKTKIIGNIVEKIKRWEESKGKRLTNGLRWNIRERIFGELAYKIVETSEDLTLSMKQVDSVLMPLLRSLEENKDIPGGIEKQRVLEDLALTGIINYDADMLSFWHRAFLIYFASKTLAEKYSENPVILEKIQDKIAWIPIIIGSTEHLDDATEFIETIKGTHLFLASLCTIEAKKVSKETITDIVSLLAAKCSSPIEGIRSTAIGCLRRFDHVYTINVFFDLLENNRYSDIRKIALEEVAKEKSDRARKVVYKLMDWDEMSIHFGSTQGSLARALSYLDEDDYPRIIEIWRKKQDLFTAWDCREAMLNIIRKGTMPDKIKKELLDFYLEEVRRDDNRYHKESGLADVLISIGDENFVSRLIESLEFGDPWDTHRMYTEDILASYRSEQVIELLSSKAIDPESSDQIREGLSAALSRSKGRIPLETFEKLLEDRNPEVRANAVKGLDKFPAADVGNLLMKYANEENAWVQPEAIKVLGDKSLLIDLIKKHMFPKKLYDISLEILLEQIRKYKLEEMSFILDSLKKSVCNDDRLLIDIAHTYYVIGKKDKAKEIIESFFKEDELTVSEFGLADLARISSDFDPPYALRIVKGALNSINKLEIGHGYLEGECVESLERIGNEEAVNMLKDFAERYASQDVASNLERVLRAINSLARRRDEEWYIDFINSNPHLQGIDLGNAIIGLGKIGSEKSIPTIKKIAALHKGNEYITNICLLSIQRIYSAKGTLIEISEKEVFEGDVHSSTDCVNN